MSGIEQGPFTGNGWDQEKVWRREAKLVPVQTVSTERANSIMDTARSFAKHGQWSDQLVRSMSQGEYHFILDVWETLPGTASFVTALYTLAHG